MAVATEIETGLNLTCNRKELAEALGVLASVVKQRTPKPVLACVKIVADEAGVTLAATNLEQWCSWKLTLVEQFAGGEVCVDAATLLDVVRSMTEETVVLRLAGEHLRVCSSFADIKIWTQPAKDFPESYIKDGEPSITIDGKSLRRILKMTLPAVANEAAKWALQGVYFTSEGGKLVTVATEKHFMHVLYGEHAAPKGMAVVVPTPALNLVLKSLDDEDEVSLAVTENTVSIEGGNWQVRSTLLEGEFAPYKSEIPTESAGEMTAAREELIVAIKQAALMTDEQSKGLRCSFDKGGVTFSSASIGRGQASVKFPAKYDGKPIEIGLNPAYLLPGLTVADTDEVTISLTKANRPPLIKAGRDFQFVVFPLNLQQ